MFQSFPHLLKHIDTGASTCSILCILVLNFAVIVIVIVIVIIIIIIITGWWFQPL